MKSLVEAIGNTPLLKLDRIAGRIPGLRLLAKAEHLNPGGSVKDRPARAMIFDGIERGLLTPGKTILEATSGNTGIADAMIGRSLGFPVAICLPANASVERRTILGAYGAELFLTDPLEGTDGAIRKARALAAERPDLYFYPTSTPTRRTGGRTSRRPEPEILAQTGGRLTHFVTGLGTSGTFVGVSRYLDRTGPVDPLHLGRAGRAAARPGGDEAHGVRDGPGDYDPTLAESRLEVATEEAYEMCRRLAREEGILRGPVRRRERRGRASVAKEAAMPATIVTVLCDGGGRYLSHGFWTAA